MSTGAITIIALATIGIVCLVIIGIGFFDRGHPRVQRVIDPIPPKSTGGSVTHHSSLPISPYTHQPYDPSWAGVASKGYNSPVQSQQHIDEEAIRRIVREELAKSNTKVPSNHN